MGRSGTLVSGTSQPQGSEPQPPSLKSWPVKTARTPSMALAAEVSIPVIRACASGLRLIATCTMPGSWMLAT